MSTLSKSERSDVADAAEEVAADWEDMRPLTRAELLQMSRSEIDAYMRDLGVTLDWERMEAEVRSALGVEAVIIDRGNELSETQVDALEKRLRKATVSVARSTANQTLGDLRQQAFLEGDDRPDDEKYLVWVSVGDGCPDCQGLHGTVFAADAWEGMAPRDGNTVCRGNCRCMLVPTGGLPAGGEGAKV